MSPIRSDSDAGRALLKAWKGRQPEKHGGVRGVRQRAPAPPSSPGEASPQHSGREAAQAACYVHSPTGTRAVTLDDALTMIRDGRFRSLDIHTDE